MPAHVPSRISSLIKEPAVALFSGRCVHSSVPLYFVGVLTSAYWTHLRRARFQSKENSCLNGGDDASITMRRHLAQRQVRHPFCPE